MISLVNLRSERGKAKKLISAFIIFGGRQRIRLAFRGYISYAEGHNPV